MGERRKEGRGENPNKQLRSPPPSGCSQSCGCCCCAHRCLSFLSGSHFIGLCTLSLLVKMSRRDGNWWQAAVIFRRPNDVHGAREAAPVNS